MKKSIILSLLSLTITVCSISVIKGCEPLEGYDIIPGDKTPSPTLKEFITDYDSYLQIPRAKSLKDLCVDTIIKFGISDLTKLPLELQEYIIQAKPRLAVQQPLSPSPSPTEKRPRSKHIPSNAKVRKKLKFS